MNYQETLQFIYSKLPSLEQKGWGAYKPGLERIFAQLKILGNPHLNFKVVHVAGTNGKGSVSHMMASVLQEQGYKVGLFTSPHLKDFRERIKVNGVEVSEQEVIQFVERFSGESLELSPSFFEYTFALAMQHFSAEKIDVAVIETGLGGRLDCTNVVQPVLSVITNVGLDHTQFLGETISEIAGEKAGIIKEGCDVVIGRKQIETTSVFSNKAASVNSKLFYAEDSSVDKGYELALKGSCQQENLRTVLKSVERLRVGEVKVSEDAVVNGLKNVVKNTGLLGRFQVLQEQPKIICDVAHNVDGIQQLFQQINDMDVSLHIIWGMSADKNVNSILSLLPSNANYYWVAADNARSLSTIDLKNTALSFGLVGDECHSVAKAIEVAQRKVAKEKVVKEKLSTTIEKKSDNTRATLLITGSAFVVAEALKEFD